VSLQVMTMHPIDLGAWDLCSWCVAELMEERYYATSRLSLGSVLLPAFHQ
jgi:hypothetical protein